MGGPEILVLGVGNTLMQDDGVGVCAVRVFAERYELPDNIRVVDGGVSGLRLLGEIAAADALIIVDALRRGGAPGTVYRFGRGDIQRGRGPFVSLHEVGIAELLAVAEFAGHLPETHVIGVEPLVTEEVGLEISQPLRHALPQIVATIAEVLRLNGAEPKEKSKLNIQQREREMGDARVVDRT